MTFKIKEGVSIAGSQLSDSERNLTAKSLAVNANIGSDDILSGTIVVTGGVGISENLNVGGDLEVTGTINIVGGTEIIGDLTVGGDLIVNGTTTTLNTTTLTVDDKNIELGASASPSDITADGGGITLLGDTNKTILWDAATGYWTSNVGFKALSIQNTPIGSTTASTGAFTTLDASGTTTIEGLLNANGGIAVDTNKFTVADGSGNTAIAGTLNVTGTSTLGAITASTGSFSGQITSTVADGTAPMVVTSTTKVANLNAETVDGLNPDSTNTPNTIAVRDNNSSLSFSQAILYGLTSGSVTLKSRDVASGTLTLPSATDTLVGKATSDTFTNKTVDLSNNTLTGTIAQFNSSLSDADFATLDGTESFTNKTVNLSNNTLTGTIAEFNTALSDANFATLAGTETLTSKTISFANNTITGTIAQFNTALSDADFATLAGTETLTNKTVNLTNNTLTGTLAQFNSALSDADFATLAGTETLTNKTVDLSDNTVTGTLAEFNSALSDADFATLAGTETLTNKTVDLSDNTVTGTLAQFNSALSDANFATVDGTETLTNKTVDLSDNTITGTIAEFNTALSDADFATIDGTETLTNKTLTNPTINAGSGVVVLPSSSSPAQTANGSVVWDSSDLLLTVGTGSDRKTVVDTDSAQTLTNKTLASPVISGISPTITLTGDVTGTGTLTDLGSVSFSTTIAANSVALGTDTTGNYIATISGTSNQISVTGSGSESAAVTLSLPQNIHTGASPTFSAITLDVIQLGVTNSNIIDTSSGNLTLDSASGTTTIDDDLVITGNLTINGITTSVNSTTITVNDKNIELGATSSPTDITANGGGITLKGATDKTFNWVNSTSAWTSSENLNVVTGKSIMVGGSTVLTSTGLGSSVVSSELTSVGTVTVGTWNATTISPQYGGTGINNGTNTITLGGAISTAGEITFNGANKLSFTTTGETSVTLPISGTLATTGNLSQFANTTSAQLAGIITDETGSGSLVFGTSPTITTPIITSSTAVALTVRADASYTGSGSGQIRISGATNTNNRLELGYNTTDNEAFIQAYTNGSLNRPVFVNPDGGNIVLGKAVVETVVSIPGTKEASSTTTGALTIGGGLGVAGKVYATEFHGSGVGITTLGTLTGLTSSGDVSVTSTTASTSTTTGALTVAGGLGIAGALYAGSINVGGGGLNGVTIGANTPSTGAFTTLTANDSVTFTKNTPSTSTTTGTLVVTGGVGISQSLFVGSQIRAGAISLNNGSAADPSVSFGGFDTSTGLLNGVASGLSDTIQVTNAGTITARFEPTKAHILTTTASTSKTTGALVVDGGIGIAKSAYLGEDLTINDGLANVKSIKVTTSSTSEEILDSFALTAFRSCKYQVQSVSGSNYTICEIAVVHDGSTVNFVQYGEIIIGTSTGTFDVAITGSNVELLFTSAASGTAVTLVRTAIAV